MQGMFLVSMLFALSLHAGLEKKRKVLEVLEWMRDTHNHAHKQRVGCWVRARVQGRIDQAEDPGFCNKAPWQCHQLRGGTSH